MKEGQVRFKVTLQLDAKWLSNFTEEEIREYLEQRLNSSLGFRGQVKRISFER